MQKNSYMEQYSAMMFAFFSRDKPEKGTGIEEITHEKGTKTHWKDGELHREDGGYLILSQSSLLIPLGSDKRKRVVFEYLKSLFNYIK